MTTYAYECNGRLYISEGYERTTVDLRDSRMRLIAAWPGTLENVPSSIRPMLREMYDRQG